MRSYSVNKHTVIIACGPAGFAGAGRVMTNTLEALVGPKLRTTFVGPELPYNWHKRIPDGIEWWWPSTRLTSGAIGHGRAVHHQEVLFIAELAEALTKSAEKAAREEATPVIWAHYLHPYGLAGEIALTRLRTMGVPASLWLTPAGSDVWELGKQLPNVTRGLLESDNVELIVTYTPGFSSEIAEDLRVHRPILTLTPSVEERFRWVTSNERAAARRYLGIADSEFVISSHSNMRPVKAPHSLVATCRKFAHLPGVCKSTLLLAGPIFKVERTVSRLTIRQLGVMRDVERLLAASDVEINLSWHDSFNLSLAEAMASGIPVISTDVVGIGSHITSAKAGVLVPTPHRDSQETWNDAATCALRRMATDISFRHELGSNGAVYSLRNFSLQAFKRRASAVLGPYLPSHACDP